FFFFFQAEDGIRDLYVTGVQTCALPILAEEARVVRRIFEWVGRDHCSLREVARRLKGEGVRTRTGLTEWDPSRICELLKNPAYRSEERRVGKEDRGRM